MMFNMNDLPLSDDSLRRGAIFLRKLMTMVKENYPFGEYSEYALIARLINEMRDEHERQKGDWVPVLNPNTNVVTIEEGEVFKTNRIR